MILATVSGWIGVPQVVGVVIGVLVVTAVVTGNAAGYLAVAGLVVLLALPFVLLLSKNLKRNPRALVWVAVLVLSTLAVIMYAIVSWLEGVLRKGTRQ